MGVGVGVTVRVRVMVRARVRATARGVPAKGELCDGEGQVLVLHLGLHPRARRPEGQDLPRGAVGRARAGDCGARQRARREHGLLLRARVRVRVRVRVWARVKG